MYPRESLASFLSVDLLFLLLWYHVPFFQVEWNVSSNTEIIARFSGNRGLAYDWNSPPFNEKRCSSKGTLFEQWHEGKTACEGGLCPKIIEVGSDHALVVAEVHYRDHRDED